MICIPDIEYFQTVTDDVGRRLRQVRPQAKTLSRSFSVFRSLFLCREV